MLPLNFRVAMFNIIGTGPYEFPGTVNQTGFEWLIVERRGDILMVSDASPGPVPADHGAGVKAPDDLVANFTQVGIRIETDKRAGDLTFLLMRTLFDGVVTPGLFFPADGYTRISMRDDGTPTLITHGRHYHQVRRNGARPVHIDAGHPPAPDTPHALNWHFDAVYRPWADERI